MITIPTVHLNGTSGEEMLRQLDEARQAVGLAIQALEGAAPNARDYCTQGPGAFTTARAQHVERLLKLRDVQAELGQLQEGVQDQVDAREAQRRR